jgi:hypothetical protein
MALTPEQVKQYRQQYGIGASKRATSTVGTPSERIAKLRGGVEAKKEAEQPVVPGIERTTPAQSYLTDIMGIGLPKTPPKVEDTSMFGSPVEAVKEAGEGLYDSLGERTDVAAGSIKKAMSGEYSPLTALATVAGQTAGLVGDVGFEALKLATPQGIERKVKGGATAVAETAPMQAAMETYGGLKEKYPETMQNVENVANIASLVPIAKVAGKTADVAGDAVTAVTRMDDVVKARRAANIENVRSAAGKIVQGDKEVRNAAVKALGEIDISDVKTYKDINERITEKVAALSNELEKHLDEFPEPMKVNEMVSISEVGGKKIAHNYVVDALRQLDELFTKTNDPYNKAIIDGVVQKANSVGLTRNEINIVAKAYGDEFGDKAFSKISGDPLTSINAQAYENTRKGLKDTVRQTLPNDVAKVLDERMSNLLDTRRLTKKLEEKVLKLEQAVQERSTLEKIARLTGRSLDALTGHSIRGFLTSFIPGNVGYKTLNALDIQEQLAKNIKQFDKALASSNKDDLVTLVVDAINKYNKKAQPGLSIQPSFDAKKVAANMDGEDFMKLERYSQMLDAGEEIPIDFGMEIEDLLGKGGMEVDTLVKKTDTFVTREALGKAIHDILGQKELGMKKVPVTTE